MNINGLEVNVSFEDLKKLYETENISIMDYQELLLDRVSTGNLEDGLEKDIEDAKNTRKIIETILKNLKIDEYEILTSDVINYKKFEIGKMNFNEYCNYVKEIYYREVKKNNKEL